MAIRKPTIKTITSTSLKQDLQDIQGRISNIAAGEMTSEVDDFLIDIYEKLDTIFTLLVPIQSKRELDKALSSIGPTYRG